MATVPNLIEIIRSLIIPSSDTCEDWEQAAALSDEDAAEVAAQPLNVPPPPGHEPRVVSLEERSSQAVYTRGRGLEGKRKRTLYRPVDLTTREVVIVLHQIGANMSDAHRLLPRVTAHYVVGMTGTIFALHPVTTRLVAANRLDRSPYHAISIEFAGNFEGIDGTGNWYAPSRNGRGRASDEQLASGRWLVRRICRDVAGMGSSVAAIVPHRISGADSRGRPNRPLCPGSRVWQEVAERVCRADGVPVPAPGARLAGTAIPDSWHGPHWPDIVRLGMASWEPG